MVSMSTYRTTYYQMMDEVQVYKFIPAYRSMVRATLKAARKYRTYMQSLGHNLPC